MNASPEYGISMKSLLFWGGHGPWVLALILAFSSLGAWGRGFWHVWVENGDGDMQRRMAEYAVFRQGDYPNPVADPPATGDFIPYTPYPPYALPMFAVFFEPGGLTQGRIMLQMLSIVAVGLMSFYGWQRLKAFGTGWAAVGALAGVAITASGNAIRMGQFSTLCVGLLILQLISLDKRRSMAAGFSWASLMIKPQIGIAFGVLFLANRQIGGLIIALCLLAVLSGIGFWWTAMSPLALADHWFHHMNMGWAIENTLLGKFHFAEWLGWDLRTTLFMAIAGIVTATAILVFSVRRHVANPDFLHLAGVCSVLGRVLTYHLNYDDVMLFPLLLSWLALALARPSAINIATLVAVAFTLWVPMRIQTLLPFSQFVQAAIWIVAGTRLVYVALSVSHARPTDQERGA